MNKFWGLVLLGLILAVALFNYWPSNHAHVLAAKAFLSPASLSQRDQDLRQAWQIACAESPAPDCRAQDFPLESVLQFVDNHYLPSSEPLYIVTSTIQISATRLALGGPSESNQAAWLNRTEFVSLFGEGYLEARVFFLTDAPAEWTISVTARHDDPPPVDLEIWLDEIQVGKLAFTRGDQSWEALSLGASISPGFHWLRVWYVNDYLDRGLKLDRNAYIKRIALTRRD